VIKRRPLARALVTLYGPAKAAVLLEPAQGRWPEHERSDRLRLGIGMAALATNRLAERWWDPYRAGMVQLAAAVARATGPLAGGLVTLEGLTPRGPLVVVPWAGPGRSELVAELRSAAVGPVPALSGDVVRTGAGLAVAALALLLALAVDADADGRLALALSVEGLVGWYNESHRLVAPRNAVTFALAHAVARLDDAGRDLPLELRG
jgi:hypothetical protein